MANQSQQTKKAVIFDMDGVLFDTERLCRETWNIIAKEQKLQDIDDVLTACTGSNRQDTILIMKKAYGEPVAALLAVATLVSLRFAIRRMVKRYSGVKL